MFMLISLVGESIVMGMMRLW